MENESVVQARVDPVLTENRVGGRRIMCACGMAYYFSVNRAGPPCRAGCFKVAALRKRGKLRKRLRNANIS